MKPRLPLSTKIFLLAFLNLALLAVVFLAFARLQFHARLDSLLFAPAEDRVVTLAQQVALDLEDTPLTERDGMMRRLAAANKAEFYLFEMPELSQVGGAAVQLPQVVQDELRRPPAGRGPGRPPPPRREDGKRGGPPPRREPEPQGRRPFQVSSQNPSLYWVGARIPLRSPGAGAPTPGVLLIASPSFVGTPLLFDYKPWLLLSLAVLVVFVACWLPFIRGLTRAVTQMSHATERIAEGQFGNHLTESRSDEVGQLASSINRMAARLAGFVTGQKRFLGDIAHELCAPIARLQFALGILERKTEPGAVDDLHQEVREMSTLVNELLSFSKSGMQTAARALVAVDVGDVARQAAAREGAGVEFVLEPGVTAPADAEALLRAISNLLRNAMRYGGEGPIRVAARRDRDEVSIVVADNGPGLPEEEIERVFEPFYRVESSRNRALGGVGLGLAIVRNSVETCGGTVRCRNRVSGGLEVEIRLAAASR